MDDFKVIDDYVFVKMPEEIDHHQAMYIGKQTDYYICSKGINNIVFDFEETRFMDSSGIGLIVGRFKKVKCFEGKIFAIHTNKQIYKILHMVSLQNIIKIIENENEMEKNS